MSKKATDAAQLRAAVLKEIARHGGQVAPRDLVEIARNPASVLHQFFEWDDTAAAEQWREVQAEGLIRRLNITVVRVSADEKTVDVRAVREVVSPPVSRTKGGRSYTTLESAMANDKQRESLLHSILRQLAQLRRTYDTLSELGDVWNAIDDALLMYEKPEPDPKRAGKTAPPPAA